MPGMQRVHIAIVLACLGVLAGCSLWGRQKKDWSGATSGEQLERLWWDDAKSQRFDDLERHTATTVLGVTSDSALDRAGLMQYWRQLAVTDYVLGDFITQANGGDLDVAYRVTFRGRAGAEPVRWRVLSVWQGTRHGWILTAQSLTPDTSK